MLEIKLPEMDVEIRESTEAHGIPAPNLDPENMAEQVEEALILNRGALLPEWFCQNTNTILEKYIPKFDPKESPKVIKEVTGFSSWGEVCEFIQTDACSEFFNMALKYCLTEGQQHRKDKDFIDGSGIGYLKKFTNRVKETLEKCFDAKYFYKVPRPIPYVMEHYSGLNLSQVANYIHPGHWSYPAGHGVKLLTTVEVLSDVFVLDKNCYDNLLMVASVLAMSRSGNFIHYPQDNLAGGVLTNLKEFK